MLSLTQSILVAAAFALLCPARGQEKGKNVTDCLPDIPPLIKANATMVTLQQHQWVWIENVTAPHWAPTTESGPLYYESLRPGYIRNLTLDLMVSSEPVSLSYVTNGDILCAATLTQYTNKSSEDADRVSYNCSRVCHDNFTSQGTRLNLPLLVYENWVTGKRFHEYLALDALDPDSRTAYKCAGYFNRIPMRELPASLDRFDSCRPGDSCLFNYNIETDEASGGCKYDFRLDLDWCVSDMDLCSYNINGNCPVCCRGDLCNLAVARKAHQRWLARMASTTNNPRDLSTTKAGTTVGSSLIMLSVSSLSVIWLVQSHNS